MRLYRWCLMIASRLVPKDIRVEWRAEWDAELHAHESSLRPWAGTRRMDLLRRASGAFWDALWLQTSRWYSLRLFGRHWRLALSALLSLSVAIAATAMGFSAYNALLLRPPGVTGVASLRLIHVRTTSDPFGPASYPEFVDYRERTGSFADIAAFPYSISAVLFDNRADQVVATQVSDNFFSVLGITARAGTLVFHSAVAGPAPEIVIGERLWRSLGSAPTVVGREVRLNDHRVTIVGVVPSTFTGMTWGFNPDVWMSLHTNLLVFGGAATELTDRAQTSLHLVGRLKQGVSNAQAATDTQLVASSIARDHPDTSRNHTAVLTPLTVTPPGERMWASTILSGLVLVVLLALVVACANVTNLLLGLAATRRHEMLVRAALGASRLQMVIPLVRESAALGLSAGLLGYGAAGLALAKLSKFHPSLGMFLPTLSFDLRPDAAVLAATLAAALAAGIGVGLVPALRAASEGLSGSLAREQSVAEPTKTRIRSVLVVIQMAVATIVLVGVSLSIKSLMMMQAPALGFTARHLSFTGIDMRRSGFDASTGPAFYSRIEERLTGMKGIEAVSLSSDVPMLGYASDHVVPDGDPPPLDGHGPETPYSVVDTRYFSTLGIRLLAGRTFDSRDRVGAPEVVIINRTLAKRHWPGRDPLGRRLRIEEGNRLVEVIGVVEDGHYGDVGEDQQPFMYFPLDQHYLPQVTVIARTSAPRDAVMLALGEMQPNIVFGGVGMMTLDDVLGLSLMLPRVLATTTAGFGVVTLALAVFGLYSTVFYSVSQRRTEMGIRVSLGATPRDLFRLVLRDARWRATAGGAIGLGAALALVPVASSIFFGIGSVEPVVIAGATAGIVSIVLTTTYAVVRPWTRRPALELLRR
ncbi:MAG: ABC transporter permease [Vicinamibacterales bacterium]